MDKNSDYKSNAWLKKNWVIFVLLAILLFAFVLRIYHVDYPVVGYHNWKETHYLTEARNFAEDGFFVNGFLIPSWNYPNIQQDPGGAHTDSLPTISIIVGILFSLFGASLFIARLTSILFLLGSILVFYLIVDKLFKRKDLAIITALLFAINPLSIFFGRQVQLLNPALFFCLLGSYFYILWRKNDNWKNLILFAVFLMIGILTKYSFVVFVVPILFTFPYKKLKEKVYLGKHVFLAGIALLSYSWLKYSSSISQSVGEQFEVVDFNVFIDSGFWITMNAFVKDNFTTFGLWLFVLGILAWFFVVKLNKKSLGYKFMNGYLIGSVLWFIFMGQKLQGHNYHQYPLIPLFVFFIAFFIFTVYGLIRKFLKFNGIKWIVVILVVLLLWNPSMDAKDRMFDTQFVGLDIAGEYLLENKVGEERVMHSSHQAYGILWHGNIMGTRGIPQTVEDMEYARTKLNANWLFIYSWDLGVLSEEERGDYIKENYEVKQMGFNTNSEGQINPVYFLLKYGGQFSEYAINDALNRGNVLEREYEFSRGKNKLHYINIE
ncbi:phospholipid carrier-dependent glycosyltransferase [Candidatus Woesearchaeota archaeon]|jgi:hypothetical protein|nr:phospholipid carrier-dependent glycosyltransferase [Candidatus Woesearchaeota archaeon]